MTGFKDTVSGGKKCRLIAFYLPQFHPIPENDRWWGKGFTEWINVAKARPLFRGHYQPHIPADLGFYDLRVPETRLAQAEMAQAHGIEGFCYWHYWFAGQRLLERPFNEVLSSGKPDFPFCLAWANQSWTGVWHGAPDRILVEQTYPGDKDYEAHFYAVLPAFTDSRYLKVAGKPVFLVYHPRGLPDAKRFTDYWRELALKVGLKGLYFVGVAPQAWPPDIHGFDATVVSNLAEIIAHLDPLFRLERIARKKLGTSIQKIVKKIYQRPSIYLYEQVIKYALPPLDEDSVQYPCVIPNWDNTPRSGINGVVFHKSSPDLFRIHLKQAIAQVAPRAPEQRLVFIKSWNEWAEGNYLEPDQRFGLAYLKALQSVCS